MKKISLVILTMCLLVLTGCGKVTDKNILNKLSKKLEDVNGYIMTGKLEIVNNDDVYNYDVETSYKKKDYYRISLKNTANDHEQIILKNDEGVFVLTPSLKKSFKFQSDWPYNNSQIYLLQSVINDLKSDSKKEMKKDDKKYIFTSTVNYPNNRSLVKQEVTYQDNLDLKRIVVYTDNDVPKMTLNVKSIDYSPKFNKNYFDLEEIMNTMAIEEVEESISIEDIIYPLVVPEGTKLKSEEKVEKTNGERVILTFEGEKPFLLVEETVKQEEELTIIPTIGEPYMFLDTIGVLADNSLTWTSGNIEYYLVSDVMSQDELVEIASSINVLPTMK